MAFVDDAAAWARAGVLCTNDANAAVSELARETTGLSIGGTAIPAIPTAKTAANPRMMTKRMDVPPTVDNSITLPLGIGSLGFRQAIDADEFLGREFKIVYRV